MFVYEWVTFNTPPVFVRNLDPNINTKGRPMKQITDTDAHLAVVKARSEMIQRLAYYGVLAMNLNLVEDATRTERFATDGTNLFYNPEHVKSLNHRQVIFGVAHEVMHPAFMDHVLRPDHISHDEWNVATDYRINGILINNKIGEPIPNIYHNPDYDKLGAVEIWNREFGNKPKPPQQQGQGKGQQGNGQPQPGNGKPDPNQPGTKGTPGSGQSPTPGKIAPNDPRMVGDVLDAPVAAPNGHIDEAAKRAEVEKWEELVDKASRIAAKEGTLDGWAKEYVEEIREGKSNWKEEMAAFVTALKPADPTWNRPNPRFIARGLYLPGRKKDGMGPVVLIRDTSKSVDRQAVGMFGGQFDQIIEDVEPEVVYVLDVDTRVANVQTCYPGDKIDHTVYGRGGTDFRPAFKWIEEHGISPACVIYATDLDCTKFPDPPPYPVLWAFYGKGRTKVPFGSKVRIK